MSFANPGALIWLIPAAGALLALYLLKMRRRPLIVPAVFLWPRRTEEIRANALFQRPRLNILFWLQLAALCAIALSLAIPQALSRSLTGKVTMIVLDGSASMRATDVEPSRFDQAVSLARQAIDEIKPGDRIGVVLAGPQPKVVFPLTDEPARNASKLDGIQAEDTSCDMGEALRLAAASLSAFEGARILVLSDGAFPSVADFQLPKGEVTFRSIGRSGKNLGISALGSAVSSKGREVFCAVRNYGSDPLSAELTIEADGRVLNSKSIRVEGGATFGTTILVGEDTEICRASIEADDVFKSDNARVAVLTDKSRLLVLLVGPGDYFLERALSLDPRVTLDRAARVPASELAGSDTGAKYDIVIFSGAPEVAVKARGVLAFGAPTSASPARSVSETPIQGPEFLAAEDHPVVRNVEFSEVFVERAAKVALRSAGQTLLEAKEGPMIVARNVAGKRQVFVAFELTKSDWPLHAGFPIFVGQVLSFLSGEGRGGIASLAAGKPFSVPISRGEEFSAVTPTLSLKGESLSPQPNVRASKQEGYVLVRGLPRVGEYRFKVGRETQRYFANLEDPDEPKIEPAAFVQLGSSRVAQTSIPQRPIDLWRWAGLLCLAVLAAEWWIFVRRS